MTVSAIRTLLEVRFNDQWASRTPIVWENVDYEPVSGTSFVTFKIVPNDSSYASMGNHPLVRSIGFVEINIMTSTIDTGAKVGDDLADTAIGIFKNSKGQGWQSNGLTCQAGYLENQMREGEWFRHIVIVPYTYDEYF